MAREQPQVNIRLPAELKDQLDAAAAVARRSLTAEITSRLASSFETSGDSVALQRQIAVLEDSLAVHQRVGKISAVMPVLLAKFLRDVLEQLPAETRRGIAGVDTAIRFANAVMHNDGNAMADHLSALLLPPAEAENTKRLIAEDILAAEAQGIPRRTAAQDEQDFTRAYTAKSSDAQPEQDDLVATGPGGSKVRVEVKSYVSATPSSKSKPRRSPP